MQEIYFPDGFFAGEEIEGFYVEEMMKRCWAALVKTLNVFDDFCKKHGLIYFADWGTLLGAVRHKGFIPWDDDIDISMPRKDFMRLMSLSSEIPDNYSLRSVYTGDMNVREPIAAFINTGQTWDTQYLGENFYGFPFIATIDIYCLTPMTDDPEVFPIQKQLYQIVHQLAASYDSFIEQEDSGDVLSQIEELTKTKIKMDGNIRLQLWEISRNILTLFGEDECNYYMSGESLAASGNLSLQMDWFKDSIDLPFTGGLYVPVPSQYQKVLECEFGSDYMTPKIISAGHDYPYYSKYVDFLKKLGFEIKE